MKSINVIAEEIAYELGEQFNYTLRESIKGLLIDYRAKLLREDIDRNFLPISSYGQTIAVKFEPVNILNEFGQEGNCITKSNPGIEDQDKYIIYKSVKPFPNTIRTKTSHINPIHFLGTATGREGLIYTTLEQYYYKREQKYMKNKLFYTKMNNYLYILNNLTLDDEGQFRTGEVCSLIATGVFEDPKEAEKLCDSDVFPDDRPFPIGLDMLPVIKTMIRNHYRIEPKDGERVNIKPDNTDV
jgi:hypothetical protein